MSKVSKYRVYCLCPGLTHPTIPTSSQDIYCALHWKQQCHCYRMQDHGPRCRDVNGETESVLSSQLSTKAGEMICIFVYVVFTQPQPGAL